MTKIEVIKKIKCSISEGVQIITPKGKTCESHLQSATNDLLNHVIEPQKVTISSAIFPEYDFEKYKSAEVWAIAEINNHWLLTLEKENQFALGFGDSFDNITMLGFSSSDAVGEWYS